MTIRTTLLSAFLVLSLVSTLIMAGAAFYQARLTLKNEIRQNLQAQARTLMSRIDATLFERIENVHSWSQLHIMQDMAIQDVDKRLARFLSELSHGYAGVYTRLFTVDSHQRIVADSAREYIGQIRKPGIHWLNTRLSGQTVSLEALQLPPTKKPQLHIHTSLRDTNQQVLGELYASFDWQEMFELLQSSGPDYTPQRPEIILIDAKRRIIAASPDIRRQHLLQHSIPLSWVLKQSDGTFTSQQTLIFQDDILVGYANSQGYRVFPGFGWSVLVLQPASQAFAPVWSLWYDLLGFLCLIAVVAVLMSLWVAHQLARPIIQLTDYTRKAHLDAPVPDDLTNHTSGEVGELAKAYKTMLQDLAQSRAHLVRASKLAVMGEMAASMAHEVRTPLGILRSSAQMLQRETQLSPAGQEMLAFITAETERLNRLITLLLECARPHPPQFETQNMHLILSHVTELLNSRARQQGVTLEAHYRATQSQLPCDKDQMTQVCLNLIMNALQWSPPTGAVTIYTDSSSQQWRMRICDQGPGIPVDDRQQVFEPFFSQRSDGIGLGLTVVQQIILAHRGDIEVNENDCGGACFQVCLQLDEAALQAQHETISETETERS